MGQLQVDSYFKKSRQLRRRGHRLAEEVLRDGMWAGRSAFILGGGRSIEEEILPAERDFLNGQLTIGINGRFQINPTIAHVGSTGFLRWARKDPFWKSRNSIKTALSVVLETESDHVGCLSLQTAPPETMWGKSLREGVCCGNNSGLIMLNLADILGADPIYLLGFDLCGRSHTQDFCHTPAGSQKNGAFGCYVRDFERRGRCCRARVFNLSQRSALTCFPKCDPHEVLRCRL